MAYNAGGGLKASTASPKCLAHTGKEEQGGVGRDWWGWDVAWDLVGLDRVVTDGCSQGEVAAHLQVTRQQHTRLRY